MSFWASLRAHWLISWNNPFNPTKFGVSRKLVGNYFVDRWPPWIEQNETRYYVHVSNRSEASKKCRH